MTEQTNEEQKQEQSPGQILVAAREALNISLDELARQTKVPLYVLEAIEKDRVPKNLPETFVRGYIRSYAKKVNIAEELVLPQVETVGVVFDEPDEEMQSFSRRNKRQALERRLSRVTWVLAIVLIAALVFWWLQDNQYSDIAPVAGDNAENVIPATEVKVIAPVKATEVKAKNDSSVKEKLSAEALAQVAEETVEEEKPKPTTEQVATSQKPLALTAQQQAAVSDNGEVDSEGFLKVEMSFVNDCWVEVYDVNGERIAIGNKPSGYSMSLNAEGPLKVLLGNPEGVSILVNDKPFNITHLPKNRVARFDVEAL